MEFRSVDPAQNRFRRYAMAIQYRVDGGAELLVTWGRIGQPRRRRVERFSSLAQLQRRYAALAARRRRHAYEQVPSATTSQVEDDRFSAGGALTVDRTTRFTPMRQANGNLGIFDARQHAFLIRDVDPGVAPLLVATLTRQSAVSAEPDPARAIEVLLSRAAA